MPPLRILHVTPYSAGAWAYGGIPRVAGTLARELARLGHSVTVCTTDACTATSRLPAVSPASDARGTSSVAAAHGNVELRVFPNLSNRLAYHAQLFLPRGLGRFLRARAHAYDVGHLHACRNLPGVMAARALVAASVPYVLSPNGTAPILERRRLAKHLFDMAAGQDVVDHATRVLAVSEAEARQLRACGVEAARIRRLANPVDLDEFREPIPGGPFRRHLGVGEAPVVLFLGKITPRKRVDTLVRAFASLERPDARLVIAGNDMGALGGVRTIAAALGLGESVIYTGLLEGRARLSALAAADVVVYASEHEVFGLVPLEALLCGVPVVVAGDSGCGEVIRNLGGQHVVQAGDERALAHAIATVLASPDRWRANAILAGGRIRDQYGAAAIASQLLDLYRELAPARRAA